jgi:uncharacterized repeat protein (TIGR01451 family)
MTLAAGKCAIIPAPTCDEAKQKGDIVEVSVNDIDNLPSWVSGASGGRELCANSDIPSLSTVQFRAFSKGLVAIGTTLILYKGTIHINAELGVTASADPPTIPLGDFTSLTAIAGGIAATPYSYMWSSIPPDSTLDPNAQTQAVSPAVTTQYTVEVTDANSSTAESDPVLVCVSDLNLSVSAPTTINPGQTASLAATVSGGTPPYDYSWEPALALQNPSTKNNASVTAKPTITTNYIITVTDAASCPTLSDSVMVTVPSPLSVSITATASVINPGGTSTLQITVSGGVPPYRYIWDPVTSANGARILSGFVDEPVAHPLESTRYELTVIDALGNIAVETETVQVAMDVTATAYPSLTVPPGTVVTLEPTVTGGAPPYSYVWAGVPSGSFLRTPSFPILNNGIYTYTVNVTDSFGQFAQGSVSVTVTSVPQPETDLEIFKTTSYGNVVRGQLVKYTITVVNNSTDTAATGVTITDELPEHLNLSYSPYCTSPLFSNSVTCNVVGSIPPQQFGGIVLSAIVDQCRPAGTVTNTASVNGNEFDPNPSNNNAINTDITVVVPPPTGVVDLGVTISEPSESAAFSPGDIFKYRTFITNNGPDAAHGIIIRNQLPALLLFEQQYSPGCSESGGVVVCCLAYELLQPGSIGDHEFYVSVHPGAVPGSTITNTISVQSDEPDSNPANNADDVTITVQ